MSLLGKIRLNLKRIRLYLLSIYGGLVYVRLDIARQKRALSNYDTAITKVNSLSESASGLFCVFVFFEQGGSLPPHIVRILTALRAADVQILLVCNHALSEGQTQFFETHCHTIIERENQGFDFGAYKDVIQYMRKNGFDPKRVILMNDSVFFARRGLDEFVHALLGDEDAIAAFENWGEDHHLQSFAVSCSADVFNAPAVRAFWEDYIPVSNRIFAIEQGEKGLSQAVLSAANNSCVIYPVSALFEFLVDARIGTRDLALHVPRPWRDLRPDLFADRQSDADSPSYRLRLAGDLANVVAGTSPIHAGAYYYAKYLNCPIFKKDIVYRQRFDFWEVETWSRDVMHPEDRDEYLHLLRQKGDAGLLSAANRRRYYVGVK